MNYRIIDISCFLIFFAACVYCTSFYYYPTDLMWAPDNYGWLYYADYLFGNFTHFNLHHLCENLIGLFIIWFFFYSSSVDGFLDKTASLLVSALSVTICLYFFTDIGEYGGLSGALHGMVAYAALLRYIKDRDIKGFFLLVGLAAKLCADYFLPENLSFNELSQKLYGDTVLLEKFLGSQHDIHFSVCKEAHLYGSLGGLVLGFMRYFFTKNRDFVVSRSIDG